jgi:hypothetical protein
MDTLPIDSERAFESALVDIGTLPLAALSSWRSDTLREAMGEVVRQASDVRVWDQHGLHQRDGHPARPCP